MRSWLPVALAVAWCSFACEKPTPAAAKYGAALSLQEETKISEILAAPEKFLGEKVLVRGEILEVCTKAGCWMEISGDQPGQQIKVKVNDGEIVFPLASQGKIARVEGVIYKIDLSEEQARGYLAHLAEERGVAFDPSSVTGPLTIHQIQGLGAEIEE